MKIIKFNKDLYICRADKIIIILFVCYSVFITATTQLKEHFSDDIVGHIFIFMQSKKHDDTYKRWQLICHNSKTYESPCESPCVAQLKIIFFFVQILYGRTVSTR